MPTTAKASTLHKLLLNKLMVLYDVEAQILKAVPKLVKKATSPELVQALEAHHTETKEHTVRLEKCFTALKVKPKKLSSAAIRGLIEDATWVMKNVEKGPALDTNLIAATQYIEHYEIAGYETAITWTKLMGHTKVESLLAETLNEEEMADKKLSTIAKKKIHREVDMGM